MTAFTESVVEKAALAWLDGLGYAVQFGPTVAPGEAAAERDDYGQVVLARRLADALARLNPHVPPTALDEAYRKLTRPDRPTLAANNHAAHRMLVEGVPVEYFRPDGSLGGDLVRVLDYDDPDNNDWLAVNQFTVVESGHERRADVVLFVNGRHDRRRLGAHPGTRQRLGRSFDGFGIFAGTKHPEAAWELLKFLISQDYGRAMARAHFLQPARASIVDDWVSYIRSEYPAKARDVEIAAFADGHLKGYSVVAETFSNMADATRLANAAWQEILTLGQAPVEKMKAVSRQIEEAQKGYKVGGACSACQV
jgi:hypothetical protein